MINYESIGKKITAYRKKLNMTQDDLAARLFVTRQALSKWENGTSAISLDSLELLTKIFNTDFNDLLCLNDKLILDEEDIFKDRERSEVLNAFFTHKVDISVDKVFNQFTPRERMHILRGIKDNKILVNYQELFKQLIPSEKKYMEDYHE